MSISTALTPHFAAQKARIEPLIVQGGKDTNTYGLAAKNFADNNMPLTKAKVNQFISNNPLSYSHVSNDQKKIIKGEAESILQAYKGLGADTQYQIDGEASYITRVISQIKEYPGLQGFKATATAISNNQIAFSNADKTRIATHQLICEAVKSSTSGRDWLSTAYSTAVNAGIGLVGSAVTVAVQKGIPQMIVGGAISYASSWWSGSTPTINPANFTNSTHG